MDMELESIAVHWLESLGPESYSARAVLMVIEQMRNTIEGLRASNMRLREGHNEVIQKQEIEIQRLMRNVPPGVTDTEWEIIKEIRAAAPSEDDPIEASLE